MEYPDALYSNNRPVLPKEEILDDQYLFQRCKPGYGWIEKEGLPDYTKIQIDPKNEKTQSYNWERFSKPHWVRFNLSEKYLIEYAVVGFLPLNIRNLHEYYPMYKEYDPWVIKSILDVEHKPEEINYSHCQLLCIPPPSLPVTKRVKRSMKLAE